MFLWYKSQEFQSFISCVLNKKRQTFPAQYMAKLIKNEPLGAREEMIQFRPGRVKPRWENIFPDAGKISPECGKSFRVFSAALLAIAMLSNRI